MLGKVMNGLLICALTLTASAVAQMPEAPANGKPPAVFVFADRTDRHAKYSSSEVFHSLVDDVFSFLRENHLSMATDEFGGRTYSENLTPIETIFTMGRDANATSVLHLNVDRPLSKWMKVTVRCYDITGKPLWEDKAESGGGFSGAHGLRVTTEKLRELLKKRLGQAGLPVLNATAEPPRSEAQPQQP